MASNAATLRREGDTLVLAGVIDRAAAIALWPSASQQLAGARTLDLSAVTGLDSAGLALLAELAAQLPEATPTGSPPGLAELCAAYRLSPALRFSASPARELT